MKIYTKTGDKGKTSLLNGGRVSKSNTRIKAYGTTDELNSFIGLLAAYDIQDTHKTFLYKIQNKLFNIGAILAAKEANTANLPQITKKEILDIENEIDKINSELEPLNEFIIPGGTIITAQCHVCRSVCRRAEREVVELHEIEKISELIIKYLNRLSDYFFTLARLLAKETSASEIKWKQ
jgi:cob(I)alamin adenosyltransferase